MESISSRIEVALRQRKFSGERLRELTEELHKKYEEVRKRNPVNYIEEIGGLDKWIVERLNNILNSTKDNIGNC